jgi:hypothetical protein
LPDPTLDDFLGNLDSNLKRTLKESKMKNFDNGVLSTKQRTLGVAPRPPGYPEIMETMKIEQIIRQTIAEFNMSPYDINNGLCEEFSQAILKKVPEAEEVSVESYGKFDELPGHIWILYKGRHYDAENPEGVNNFMDLKIFKGASQ